VDPEDLPLCYEVNIIRFAEEAASGNDSLTVGVDDLLPGNDGWAAIDLTYGALTDPDAQDLVGTHERLLTATEGALEGLPVTGFAVQTYANNSVNASGNVANYAAAFVHKTETSASGFGGE
jgi:hypothetical protein